VIGDGAIVTARLVAERAGDPGLADAGRTSEILPKNSSSMSRSTICIILASVSVSPLCDPFGTAAVCISR